jgi:hypothetical protein
MVVDEEKEIKDKDIIGLLEHFLKHFLEHCILII